MTIWMRATMAIGVALILGGCGLFHGSAGPTVEDNAPPLPPTAWIGRWNTPGQGYMDIMPAIGAGQFMVTIKNDGAYLLHYKAHAVPGGVAFMRDNQRVTIRKGIGDDTGYAAFADRTDCVILASGKDGYCRDAGSLDALPLARGTYAEATQSCYAPDPNSLLRFDGRAFQSTGEAACRSVIVGQQGVIFTIKRSCGPATDPSANAMPSPTETVTVASANDFALADGNGNTQLYAYCPAYQLPLALRSDSR